MPRYYFHTVAGTRVSDWEGTELPDLQAARETAVRFAGELLRDDPTLVRDGEPFGVEVTTADGALLFSVAVLATSPPATVERAAA